MKTFIALLLPLLMTFVSGCSIRGAIRKVQSEGTFYSDESEYLGNAAATLIRAHYPPEPKPELWRTAVDLKTRLLKARDRIAPENARRQYRVVVIQAPFPNAFALPNGKIYLTAGLFELCSSEAALATVLAHEIAHVEMSHSMARLDRMGTTLLSAGLLTYSKDQREELQADQYALKLLTEAGFSSRGALDFFRAYQTMAKLNELPTGGFWYSHPAVEERIRQVEAHLAGPDKGANIDYKSSDTFIQAKLAIHQEKVDYYPHASYEEEFPRYSYGNDAADNLFRSAVQKVLVQYDYLHAKQDLLRLKGESSTPRQKAVAEVWLARLALRQHDLVAASAHLESAQTLWPELESPRWLKLLVLDSSDKKARAARLWKEYSASDRCAQSAECVRMSAETAVWLNLSPAKIAKASKRLREFLSEKPGIDPQTGQAHFSTLSLTFPYEVTESLKGFTWLRPKEVSWRLPSGYQPSPQVQDVRLLETDIRKSGRSYYGYQEKGWIYGLEGGATQWLRANQGTATSGLFSVRLGGQIWPWEFGVKVNVQGGSGIAADSSLTGAAFYAGRLWASGKLRPWTHLAFGSETLARFENEARQDLASGWRSMVHSGVNYRLTAPRQDGDFWLTAGMGIGYLKLGSAGGLTWQGTVGITGRLRSLFNAGTEVGPALSDEKIVDPPEFY